MGREVRRVPADWQHPKDDAGRYKPLYDGEKYAERKKEWLASLAEKGLQETLDYHGNPPDAGDYTPAWLESERTHLMMYEDTSEGTPISPAFKTPEELARWLADNGASAFGDITATYEQWLATVRQGWSVGMVYTPQTGLQSGVADNERRT